VSDAISPLPDFPLPAVPGAAPADTPRSILIERRLRLWPGVVLVVLQAAAIFVPGWIAPGTMTQFLAKFYGPMVATLLIAVWWLFFSRLRWSDRVFLFGVFVGGGIAAAFVCHESFRFALVMYALPVVTSAWVLWLLATPFLDWPVRRIGLVAVFLLAWGAATLLRMDGVDGSFSAEFQWRWGTTAEERFLAEYRAKSTPGQIVDEVVKLEEGDWPGFRGPNRDGRLTGVRIGTDWSAKPPQPKWRHRVGPGWSSFAVVGHRLYTQEQRDQAEAVVCYDANTGDELWVHEDEGRFKETVSGAGPRATPTFHDSKIYALTANGRLNCLDAATGRSIWEKDAKEDAKASEPIWAFSSSPLVWHDVVTVFTGGPDDKSVSGYDASSGDLLWSKGKGSASYCSPQPATLHKVEQILLATDAGLMALDPKKGDLLWEYGWPTEQGMPRCVQPAVVNDSDVLLGTGVGVGERCVRVARNGDSWGEASEEWTNKSLKAYYNDRVIHKGHVYGFDGNIFTCVSLADRGKARWRGGRYGNGQVLLLADQDLLLVLSEKGEVVLVAADPEKHRELGRFSAIEGKTWNHPVVAHGKLFVRNGEEAACYELP
jgi:outer membrane protein assembly factor BamB